MLFILITGVIISVLNSDRIYVAGKSPKEINENDRQVVDDLLRLADSLKENDIDKALAYVFDAEKVSMESQVRELLPRVYVAKGNLFKYKSDYPEALSMFLSAISLYDDM